MNVEDILGFAQIKAGKFTKAVKPFSVKRAIEETMTIQQYKADSLKINMESEFVGFEVDNKVSSTGKLLNFVITSDEMRLKQVIMNLQSNALKFTRSGGKVKITATYVQSIDNQIKDGKIQKKK